MKQLSKILLVTITAISLLASCKKNDDNGSSNGLPPVVNTIISQAIIDSLTHWGLTINKGTTPTQIAGFYFISKNDCIFDNSGSNGLGDNYANYKLKFANQDNNAFTVSVGINNVSTPGIDSSFASTATFIAGNGNLFTVFSQQTGVTRGIKDTILYVYSGEIATSGTAGIKNLQYALYMKGKSSDLSNTLIKVGACRIFKDEDGLSELSKTYYANSPQAIQAPAVPQSQLISNKMLPSTK